MNIGDKIDHENYGKGIVSQVDATTFKAIFAMGGEREFSLSNSEFKIVETVQLANEKNASASIDINALEKMLLHVLDKYAGLQEEIEIGEKWIGGTMELKPEDKSLKSKEIPIEAFFHKIVMLRDRLRVLEQNINSHDKLSDQEKVHMQQYITKCYGSLTTFNVLFKDKEDYFIGDSKK